MAPTATIGSVCVGVRSLLLRLIEHRSRTAFGGNGADVVLSPSRSNLTSHAHAARKVCALGSSGMAAGTGMVKRRVCEDRGPHRRRPAAQQNFHLYSQLLHVHFLVVGSSAERVWTSMYSVFIDLHFGHFRMPSSVFLPE